jgi:hypothetical protein
MTFDETTNLVPFVSNAVLPGNQIGQLTFTFIPSTPSGTTIPLTIDTALTQLSNEGGTTSETLTNGGLLPVNGAVTMLAIVGGGSIPTVSTWGLILLSVALVVVVLRRI